MIDLHCHPLPALDDGPADERQALDFLRAQAAVGVRTVVATPHVSYSWPDVTAPRIAAATTELDIAARRAELPLRILPGAEVALTRAIDLDDAELSVLTLGGGPWLLLEPPHMPATAAQLETPIASIMRRGHRVLLAHPERCPGFLREPDALRRLVAGGARCSITAGSLTGRFGREVQRYALALLGDGLVHDVASDAHGGSATRTPGLAEHLAQVGLGELMRWFCRDAPAALLSGDELPPCPPLPEAVLRRGQGGRLARLLRR